MKIIKITLSLIFFIGTTLILFLQIDDDINPEAQQAYEQVTAPTESKAYIFYLGLYASTDDQPEVIGEKVYKSIQEMQKSDVLDQTNKPSYTYPEENKLAQFTLNSKNEIYAEKIFSQTFNSATLSKEQQVLLKRYKRFMAFDDFHTLAKPGLNNPLDGYWYLTSGNDLLLLHAIDIAKKGEFSEAKKSILENINQTRVQLKNADNLIGRAIFKRILANNLDVLSSLIHQYKIPFKAKIATLTTEEKDVTASLNREFSMRYIFYKSLDRSRNFLANDSSKIQVPSWVNRIFFKPNMSINNIYSEYKRFIDLSFLQPEEFAKAAENSIQSIKNQSNFRNYFGSVLHSIGLPNFNDYSARSFYLDSKITLFNQTANQLTLPNKLGSIQNPFYKDKVAFYNDDKSQICFEGPLPDKVKQGYRCLSVEAKVSRDIK